MGELTKTKVKVETKKRWWTEEEIIVTEATPSTIVSKEEGTKTTPVKKRTIKVPLLIPVFQKPADVTIQITETVSPPEPFDLTKIRPIEKLVFLKAEKVEAIDVRTEVFTPHSVHLLDAVTKKTP
ncbi:hypothetical protein X802_06720 [Thermococcus guaymasensis DSM 11113]|uniref:Uncharacterized protein n=1 Tax=Thermococcus guaymasensis DSM 11113 TaxID=1432656 RepID=A0A0X1KN82_9EURY|nr:hypothetical protein [Thermococcus guaymasensis]AJC72751.1 hypothetical protein X802_06720 [Thermococcus guaymasensis DSM 11113]